MAKWLLPVLAFCMPVFHAGGATIGFGSSIYRAPVGSTLGLPILISGLPSGVAAGAFDLTIEFDPSLLTYDRFVFSNFFGDPEFQAADAAILLQPGMLEAYLISYLSAAELQALQPSSFELGTVFLTNESNVKSSVIVTGLVSDALGAPIDVGFGETTVSGPIPEPATLSLLLSGLIAVAALACRRPGRKKLT